MSKSQDQNLERYKDALETLTEEDFVTLVGSANNLATVLELTPEKSREERKLVREITDSLDYMQSNGYLDEDNTDDRSVWKPSYDLSNFGAKDLDDFLSDEAYFEEKSEFNAV